MEHLRRKEVPRGERAHGAPTPTQQAQVSFGSSIGLAVEGGLTFVGPLDWDGTSTGQYFPTIVNSAGVILKLVGGSGPIVNGSTVQIQTTESAAGNYSYLGAWSDTHCLYYYLSGYSAEEWTIVKLDPTDPNIHFGDSVYFISQRFTGQTIAPTDNPYIGTNKQYLTTTDQGVPTIFTVIQR
jgi:hypothetical protein